jgi:NADH:ubiquinone oxidoreductase subunit 5 (subunit L)/multisubunit Na+/H+ antiporter MnhA subunit
MNAPDDLLFEMLAMASHLVWLVPLLPLLAAALIAVLLLLRRGAWAMPASRSPPPSPVPPRSPRCCCCWSSIWRRSRRPARASGFGEWLRIGAVPVRLSFVLDAYSLPAATLVTLIAWIALRFSATYLHRESRFPALFPRHVPVPCRHAADRPGRQRGAGLRRLGTGRFQLLAAHRLRLGTPGRDRQCLVCLSSATGSAMPASCSASASPCGRWAASSGPGWPVTAMTPVTARLLAFGFVLAALVKSAQLPFTPWIARALEGPTPSSAVFYGSLMVHAGVYLLCRLQGLLVQVPDLLALLAVVGLATAVYGGLCALVQSDVKSALVFSTVTQVGLMFVLCCGLGLFWLAAGYAGLHAAWRAYQFLLAPAYMHLGVARRRPVPRWLPSGAGGTRRRCSASGSSRWPAAC